MLAVTTCARMETTCPQQILSRCKATGKGYTLLIEQNLRLVRIMSVHTRLFIVLFKSTIVFQSGSYRLVVDIRIHCFSINKPVTEVACHLPSPTSQFLNGTYQLSELVPAGMALLMVQSRSVLLLRLGQSAGIWRVVAGKMCARALDLSI